MRNRIEELANLFGIQPVFGQRRFGGLRSALQPHVILPRSVFRRPDGTVIVRQGPSTNASSLRSASCIVRVASTVPFSINVSCLQCSYVGDAPMRNLLLELNPFYGG